MEYLCLEGASWSKTGRVYSLESEKGDIWLSSKDGDRFRVSRIDLEKRFRPIDNEDIIFRKKLVTSQ